MNRRALCAWAAAPQVLAHFLRGPLVPTGFPPVYAGMAREPQGPDPLEMSMDTSLHRFHVPVMGTGFTIDSALRGARLGISTVISLVDDHLVERVRRHYAAVHGFPEETIGSRE